MSPRCQNRIDSRGTPHPDQLQLIEIVGGELCQDFLCRRRMALPHQCSRYEHGSGQACSGGECGTAQTLAQREVVQRNSRPSRPSSAVRHRPPRRRADTAGRRGSFPPRWPYPDHGAPEPAPLGDAAPPPFRSAAHDLPEQWMGEARFGAVTVVDYADQSPDFRLLDGRVSGQLAQDFDREWFAQREN